MGATISTVDTDTRISLDLGNWLSRTKQTIYQAATDGFVCAVSPVDTSMFGYSDNFTPPTTERVHETNDTGDFSITFPVKKDDYWEADGAGITDLWWIPLETTVVTIK